jgi:hypothetical protein
MVVVAEAAASTEAAEAVVVHPTVEVEAVAALTVVAVITNSDIL